MSYHPHPFVLHVNPYVFQLHGLPLPGLEHLHWGVRWYSLMYLISFLIVYQGLVFFIRKGSLKLTTEQASTLLVYGIVGMVLGARLAYVFLYNWDFYQHHLWDIAATWHGGLSFHGGIVGVCAAFWLFAKQRHMSFFHITDHVVRLIPIGIMLGRIGNLLNGELWGRVADPQLPWGVVFPGAGPLPRHPSQIYQSLGEGLGLFLVLWWFSRRPQHRGALSCYFILFYSLFRFFVEYFRAADEQVNYLCLPLNSWLPLDLCPHQWFWQLMTRGQVLCGLGVIVGFVLLKLTKKQAR